jgi:sulfofructose kinase
MTRSVLCVGFASQDYVFALDAMPRLAEKYVAHDLAVSGGGISANAAVAVARLGGRAALATRLGDDGLARDILAELQAEGVDCTLARRFPGHRSALSAILIDAEGERCIISYADRGLPDDPSWLPEALPGVDAVIADTRWQAGAAHALRVARESGAIALLDADRLPTHPDLIPSATHIAWSAQAVREMTGRDDIGTGLMELARAIPAWMAVTDGGRGTFIATPDGLAHVPTFPVTAVDTLGAGDVFHAGLALGLAEGLEPRAAVRFGSAAAAIKCTRFGGRSGAPTRTEVEQFLRESV